MRLALAVRSMVFLHARVCVCVCVFLCLRMVHRLVQPPVLAVTWSASSHIDYLTTGLVTYQGSAVETNRTSENECVCVCVKGESWLSKLSDSKREQEQENGAQIIEIMFSTVVVGHTPTHTHTHSHRPLSSCKMPKSSTS